MSETKYCIMDAIYMHYVSSFGSISMFQFIQWLIKQAVKLAVLSKAIIRHAEKHFVKCLDRKGKIRERLYVFAFICLCEYVLIDGGVCLQ